MILIDLIQDKFKETLISVCPVVILVVALHFLAAPLETPVLARFLLGSVLVILGLTVFLIGVEIAISPLGNAIGSMLAQRRSLALLLAGGLVLGFVTSVAEPDLAVLADQIQTATGGELSSATILIVVAAGIGVMLALALARIVFQVSLRNLLLVIYLAIGALCLAAPRDFLGIAFDSGGATTGSMTVPFVLALGMGVSAAGAGTKSEEDSFGLIGIASGGPMIAVLTMALVSGLDRVQGAETQAAAVEASIWAPFAAELAHEAASVLVALAPLFIITLILQKTSLHLGRRAFSRILKGFVYTWLGFVVFMAGVNAGFMDAGRDLGTALAGRSLALNLLVAAVIGCVVILAEPSVHVLTAQISDITSGAIRSGAVLVSFAAGVSAAIVLSVLRLRLSWPLWILLAAGYGMVLVLSRFTPALFVGIAFDSGGVASGPMTATFVLAFAQGIAQACGAGAVEAFGVIALVALTPLISLQIFGLVYGHLLHKKEMSGQEGGPS